MNLQQLPRPIEMEDEPNREDFASEGEYEEAILDWRVRNAEPLFWKFYEIRDVFICDDPETESLIALD